jgi:hypothetical protein
MEQCRYCFEGCGELISPCACKGSIKHVHKACLQTWVQTSHNNLTCNICKSPYTCHFDPQPVNRGGGLMDLVAYGAQDVYLTGNPKVTFWNVTYRRHTQFSMSLDS